MSDLRGLLGLAAILALAFLVSNNRGRVPWRTVPVGLAIRVAFAALVLRWSAGRDALDFFAGQVKALIDYTSAGVDFLFGDLAADGQETIFALQVLPVIIFLGALVGLLFYLVHAHEQGRVALRRHGDLPRTVRSAADDPVLPQAPYALGALCRDDRRLRFGRGSTLVGYALMGAPLPYRWPPPS